MEPFPQIIRPLAAPQGTPSAPPREPVPRGPRPRSLSTALERLPGVGTLRAEKLRKLELVTAADALMHFPREYRDFSGAHSIGDCVSGEHASLAGEVTDVSSRLTGGGRQMLSVRLRCQGGSVRAVWFNMPFMTQRFAVGMQVVIAGPVKQSAGHWEFPHPEVRWLIAGEQAHASDWLAVYPLSEGVQQSHVRAAVQAALEHAADLPAEAFPEALLVAKGLLPIERALREIHCPSGREMIDAARRRFVYEELFMLQLALRMHRSQQETRHAAPVIAVDARIDGRIRARFPFPFTAAQTRVCGEIAADMARPQPMNRLLQGDVGSGKTAVAFYALLATVATRVPQAAGAPQADGPPQVERAPGRGRLRPETYQAALMAPTELLARQHLATLERLLEEVPGRVRKGDIKLELLVGGQTPKRRQAALERIASGEAQIVIGTQALVCGAASFRHLGLVVIDEQHRFGVVQRGILQQEQADPHVLVMTATPIPRTIAHAIYGDLDVSTLDGQPPGRQPVATYRVGPNQLESWWDFFRKKLAAGRQGYVVVPAVEESKRGLESISSAFENLSNGPLEAFRLGLVHGRLSPKKKQQVMEDFRAHRIDVLVATSVIEVGIDVPQATLMTILDADSFGLAQLHQLRGRVARGAVQGVCGAVTASGDEPHGRIDAFVATTDGFALAEKDLLLRGPGDLVGTRQSGSPPMYLADLLRDASVVAEARRDALDLYLRDPTLADPALVRMKQLIVKRWGETLGLGQVG